jgi:hypothetical protein
MRINTPEWTISSAVKIGHYHLSRGANCQDASNVIISDGLICGIGCDGCGEGNNSEVGAQLLCHYALGEINHFHSLGYVADQIVNQLFGSIIRFIQVQILQIPRLLSLTLPEYHDAVACYIKHYWLATIVGFVIQEDIGIIFSCGDGIYVIDSEIVHIDQNNTPQYIAYCALPHQKIITLDAIPDKFTIHKFEPKAVSRIMVASDGFDHHNELKLQHSQIKEPELTFSLHGQQWGKKGHWGLKKWMNSRSYRGYFGDDCFIITAERLSGAENNIH